ACLPASFIPPRPLPPSSASVIAYSGDLRALVAQIRERYPKDIWLMGGGDVTRSSAEADLIDIWTVAFVPTLLGAGLPMFPPRTFHERRLKLTRTHEYH